MKVPEIINRLNLECLGSQPDDSHEITGCYVSDLLSLAMSNVQSGNVWITVQTNINILGIASLTDASCVIVAQSMNIDKSVIDKANKEGICLLRSNMDAYTLCNELGKLI